MRRGATPTGPPALVWGVTYAVLPVNGVGPNLDHRQCAGVVLSKSSLVLSCFLYARQSGTKRIGADPPAGGNSRRQFVSMMIDCK